MPIGETNLATLLRTLEPILSPETYVFITTTQPLSSLPLSTIQSELIFREPEGLTLITSKELAESHGYYYRRQNTNQDDHGYTFPCKKILLKVHSSLEAVGLMATISSRFAKEEISCNIVGAYFHDHIFVPVGKEEQAMRSLEELGGRRRQRNEAMASF
ncbi:hypothetical protein UA08_04439 [Talaromyces atroroseus]|uniref:DUF2241 domain-containing protein n=1 Tax=Talaromyces atroroseus TaxID=1441469 RepID=A0A1Q5Q8S9_TALAT|nr:hypothetical protein UA08_04439 [Talaromyces atroroseus]OKL60514.1 hypothetical protein UA08_04439 [Talaromyces atroroseus]